jgi:hypothetical protein
VNIRLDAASEFQIPGIVDKILHYSSFKDSSVFRVHLHSHPGEFDHKEMWDDGTTKGSTWIRQNAYHNFDICAVDSHNWVAKQEVLNFVNEKLTDMGIVFVPGWENTTTVYGEGRYEAEFKSPHILVFCESIETAMDARESFLKKKLEGKPITSLTPVLCGVPRPFDEHIAFLKEWHDQGRFALFVAHPSSHLPGVDLLDPDIITTLGFDKVWSVLNMVDGVEMYNPGEGHGSLDYNLTDKTKTEDNEAVRVLSRMMIDRGIKPYLSPPMINYVIGLWAEENGKFTIFGHDDHSLPDIGKPCVYSYGHSRYTLGPMAMKKLQDENRKPTTSEFVRSISSKKFPGIDEDEHISLHAFAYAKMTPKGPMVFESRQPHGIESVMESVSDFVAYGLNVAKPQLEYLWLRLKSLFGADVKVSDLDGVLSELHKARQKCRNGAKPPR